LKSGCSIVFDPIRFGGIFIIGERALASMLQEQSSTAKDTKDHEGLDSELFPSCDFVSFAVDDPSRTRQTVRDGVAPKRSV
jgi:hypothetical protein